MQPFVNENLVDLSRALNDAFDEAARQRAIARARRYHDGRHFVKLTDRLRTFLRDVGGEDDGTYLHLNICRTVVMAIAERLMVARFDSNNETFQAWINNVWKQNNMDIVQDEAHEAALRDGETFLIVGWDADAGRPRITHHLRYVDAAFDSGSRSLDMAVSSNTGVGVKVFYEDDDPSLPMKYASRRWMEEYQDVTKRWRKRQRCTLYYPDRIEKYVRDGSWQPIRDEGDVSWPIPWVDDAGRPIGIPVVHMRNAGLVAEAWEAIPLQNAINKTLVDLLTAGDTTAFKVLVALGFFPTTDGQMPNETGSNVWKIEPGSWVGTRNADASVQVIPGEDLEKLIAPINQLIYWAAMVTDTPVSRFITTRQIAAGETLKQQEGPLLNKIRKRQVLFGDAWERVAKIAGKLDTLFGRSQSSYTDDISLECRWEPAEVREDMEVYKILQIKRSYLGVPLEQIWKEAGYTDDEIRAMKRMKAEDIDNNINNSINNDANNNINP